MCGKGHGEVVGTFGCARGLSGASGVGYWWGFSGVHTSWESLQWGEGNRDHGHRCTFYTKVGC